MKFLDPYGPHGPFDAQTHGRVQFNLPREQYMKFVGILPHRRDAVYQTTFSILTQKLLTLLEKHGINNFLDGDKYKDLITNLVLSDGGTASAGPVQETKAPYDGRGTKGKRGGVANAKNKPANV